MTIQEFEELFNLYYESLCQYSLKYVRDLAYAEDIVQELFIALWEKRKKLPPIHKMEAYLKTSVRNRSINFLQSKIKKNHFTELSEGQFKHNNENPVNLLEVKELQNILNNALDSLPESYYTIYTLKRFGSLSNKEIAKKLNLSEKTIENYTTITFRMIRDYVRKYFSR